MARPMLDGKLMFPNEYLAAEEFGGKDVTLAIRNVKFDDLKLTDGATERKPIVFFEKTKKKFVLNKTNATTIAKLHGAEARGWAGKRITLYPTTCQAFGKTVDCIRVRDNVPPEARQQQGASGSQLNDERAEVGTESEASVPDEEVCRRLYASIQKEAQQHMRKAGLESLIESAVYDTGSDPAGINPLIAQGKFFEAAKQIMKYRGWQ